MINFTDSEKTKVVYGIYSNISHSILPVFESTLAAAYERSLSFDRSVGGMLEDYNVIALKWSQAKLIYNNYEP